MPFDSIPSKASLKPQPWKAHVSDEELDAFKTLLKVSRIGPPTYENQIADPKDFTSFGIKRQWLADAKEHWMHKYDWRKCEDRINSFPNWSVPVEDNGFTFEIHFAALFSKKADAVPLVLSHGWPGSFLEFLDVLDEFRSKYDENSLPFHVVVPSLPGYGYSNGPPLDKNFDTEGIARVVDKLMIGLGFGDGYVAQGGDVGSFVSRIMGVTSPSCKAVHLNLAIGIAPTSDDQVAGMSDKDKKGLARTNDFATLGNAYAREHGTRPATIGLVLSSSPIALLAWIGEKFLQWSDTSPPIDQILDGATLYWFTSSFPRAIFPYRQFFGPKPTFFHNEPHLYINKPMGYSWHPQELAPIPVSLVKESGNLVWYKEHTEGGHFSALEKPKLFVSDMESFIGQVWQK